MILWVLVWAYIGLLCALVIVTFRGGEPMRRTALTLLGVMLIAYAYQVFAPKLYPDAGGTDYSVFMILVNTLAASIVLRHWAGRWQAVIGCTFVLQIGTDTGRVASDIYFQATDMDAVYWMTVTLAYVQLAILGGWFWDERTGYLSKLTRRLSADPSRSGGMA